MLNKPTALYLFLQCCKQCTTYDILIICSYISTLLFIKEKKKIFFFDEIASRTYTFDVYVPKSDRKKVFPLKYMII